jgi:SCO1/SenC
MAATAAACGGDDGQGLVGYLLDPTPALGACRRGRITRRRTVPATGPARPAARGVRVHQLPDVCPTALAAVGQVLDRLGPTGDRLDLAMLTVDPVRDTPGVLTAFTQGFVARGHALRVDDTDQLERVVQAFGATTVADHGHAGNTTEVGHTDHTYLVDARGDVVVTGTADMTASDITNDLRTLLTRLDD